MRAMMRSSLVLAVLASVMTLGPLARAAESERLPSLPEPEQKAVAVPVSLGDVTSFEVYDPKRPEFSTERGEVPAEISEYARVAIQNERRLQYNSPAKGVLRFQCVDIGCYRIKAQVTYGTDGPVLWKASKQFRQCPLTNFGFQPDGKKFAVKMVNQLANDYQKSVHSSPAKIEIHEE